MITPVLPLSCEQRDTRRTAFDQHLTTTQPDDAATGWALAARTGDPDAVDRFVRALHPDVVRYVTYLSADRQLADDLAQDTFLRALGSLHRFEGRSSARTWLLSIARRTVVDSLRHAAARPRRADVDDWTIWAERAQPGGLPGFDDGVALLDLLDALPAERREAFVLTQLAGLPYAEAAEAGGCPVGTIRSRVARARATLVGLLEEAEGAAGAARAAGAQGGDGAEVLTAVAA
ncbi:MULTISPECIES: sigma-70 family RNA polymerase sigma factor [unclassified Streptomyces]|uniref:sigma-70 family RNA polymerase sigma factor n=1 Tax=unclassified Streptomyces TaxID=2593676 RepID=UPI0007097EE8|nr:MULTISPECIES: sigma-70 family RNA polymerase sigma factor [unclassified Streptomyces]KRD02789.1 RNA polymerase subunit sigma [Streptomyces sp. Root264]